MRFGKIYIGLIANIFRLNFHPQHLKQCLAHATHSFKWVKISQIIWLLNIEAKHSQFLLLWDILGISQFKVIHFKVYLVT